MKRAAVRFAQKWPLHQRNFSVRSFSNTTIINKPNISLYSSHTTQPQQRQNHYDTLELYQAVRTLIDSPVGEINDWVSVEHIIRNCTKEERGGLELSFEVLDRISQEDTQHDHNPNFHPLNTVIWNWRQRYSSHHRNNQNAMLSPQQVVDKIRTWQSEGFLQPDAKTYTMVIEASSKNKNGLEFSEDLLEWMVEESKTQFLIQPTTFTFASVMNAWATSERPEAPLKIQDLIQKMKALHKEGWPDVAPNIVVYNILLNALSRSGNVQEAEQLIQTMLSDDDDDDDDESDIKPDRISFTTILSAYSKLGHKQAASRAETLLSQMHELYDAGYDFAKPNMISYTIVMDCHARLGQGEQAEALLRNLIQQHEKSLDPDFLADLTTYNTVLLAWARSNNPKRADRFLRFMYEEAPNIQPDERSFNIVLSAWAKVGDAKRAEEILTRMHELALDGELESRPTVVAYNTVLDGWSKSKNTKTAYKRSTKILNHMMELYGAGDDSVQPNERTWNTVLNCFAKAGQIQLAEQHIAKFLEASTQNQVDGQPSVRTWNTLLAACLKKKDVQMAKKFWNQMKEAGIQPDVVSYNTLLNCYARSHRPNRKGVEYAFRQLQQDPNVQPNRISYLALISFWIQSDKVEKAETILKDMCKNHALNGMLPPDRDLFHKVMMAWSTKNKPRETEALLFKMMELSAKHGFDLNPTVETYNRLLNAWAKSSELHSGERADSILRQMESFAVSEVEDDIASAPDIISYNSVLNAWANSGDPTAVTRIEHLILEMILKGSPELNPTVVSYGTWLKAIESSSEEDKGRRASEVLNTMKIHKLQPTDFILRKVESMQDSSIAL